MQVFKTLGEAAKIAGLQPIFQIDSVTDRLFVVLDGDIETMKQTEVILLTPEEETDCYRAAGHITLKHLDRLGYANWAATARPTAFSAFPVELPVTVEAV